MAKKKDKVVDNFVMFDVTYEDGTKSSRRKINAPGMDGDELEAFALTEIMNQDRKIADMGGRNRGGIKDLCFNHGSHVAFAVRCAAVLVACHQVDEAGAVCSGKPSGRDTDNQWRASYLVGLDR
jgi:hypothetical protein